MLCGSVKSGMKRSERQKEISRQLWCGQPSPADVYIALISYTSTLYILYRLRYNGYIAGIMIYDWRSMRVMISGASVQPNVGWESSVTTFLTTILLQKLNL